MSSAQPHGTHVHRDAELFLVKHKTSVLLLVCVMLAGCGKSDERTDYPEWRTSASEILAYELPEDVEVIKYQYTDRDGQHEYWILYSENRIDTPKGKTVEIPTDSGAKAIQALLPKNREMGVLLKNVSYTVAWETQDCSAKANQVETDSGWYMRIQAFEK